MKSNSPQIYVSPFAVPKKAAVAARGYSNVALRFSLKARQR
jgi:hypothetical protein